MKSLLSLNLDTLNFVVSSFLTKEDICNLKCACKYLSEIYYTNVSLSTLMNIRYYQLKNLKFLTITDSIKYCNDFLFLDLTPLQSLIRFCFQPDTRGGAMVTCDEVELILPDKIEDMTISLGFDTNLILRHFPKCLTKFYFAPNDRQVFHLPKLPKTLKKFYLNYILSSRHPKDIIPKWINDQDLDLDYFILSGIYKFSKIPRTKVFQNLGDKDISAEDRTYLTLNEETFVAPEVIKELKGEILINSSGVGCLEKFIVLETLYCFIDVKEDEYHSLFERIQHIQNLKFTLIILEEEIGKIKKCLNTLGDLHLNMQVNEISSIYVLINGQFVNDHLVNFELENRLLVEIY
jgi:hypothetical protein